MSLPAPSIAAAEAEWQEAVYSSLSNRLSDDQLLRRVLVADARDDLSAFCELTAPWRPEPWQALICDRLAKLADQTGQRLLIHGPPQAGKSWLISQRFPAWLLGRKPEARIRLACYNISHAERFSKVNLALLRGIEFREVFPDPGCRVPKIAPAEEWSTTARAALLDAQPSFKALGLGSGVVGMGMDLMILDDPYKNAEEAWSDASNASVWDWWKQVVVPRLNPETNVVVMFHRWRADDFTGRLLEDAPGAWEQMRFPAIADDGENDPTGRAFGEALTPRYPVPHLRRLEESDPAVFLSQFQGRPTRAEGNFLKVPKVGHVEIAPASADYPLLAVYQAWDLALSMKTTADYTVGATLAVDADQNVYLLDVHRERMDFNDTLEAMALQAKIWKPRSIAIESVGYQSAAFQEASRRYMLPFREVKVAKDKVTRAQLLAERIAAGKVFGNRGSHWWPAFHQEALSFPGGRHDDQVDAFVHALHLHPATGTAWSEVVPSRWSPEGALAERRRQERVQSRSRLNL